MPSSPTVLRRGTWTDEEDILLRKCIEKFGEGKWHQVPDRAGLNRCRKSCRLRWLNYLRPNIKRGKFTSDEVDLIIRLHKLLGNRWSLIAGRLPGRTANDIKNYWNSHLEKKLRAGGRYEAGGSSSKSTALETTATTIFKPRPLSFSKNFLRLRAEAANAQTNTRTNDQNPGTTGSAPKSASLANHDIQWWENLLNDKEMSERPTWSFNGSGDDRMASLWCEDISYSLEAKEGGNYAQDGQNGSGDFCTDADLWDLLISDQQ